MGRRRDATCFFVLPFSFFVLPSSFLVSRHRENQSFVTLAAKNQWLRLLALLTISSIFSPFPIRRFDSAWNNFITTHTHMHKRRLPKATYSFSTYPVRNASLFIINENRFRVARNHADILFFQLHSVALIAICIDTFSSFQIRIIKKRTPL